MTVGPNSGEAYIQVTLSKVYDEVTGARREIQDLAATVRPMTAQLADHEVRIRYDEQHGATKDDVDKILKRLNERVEPQIEALQRWRYTSTGLVTVVSIAGGALVGRLISGH